MNFTLKKIIFLTFLFAFIILIFLFYYFKLHKNIQVSNRKMESSYPVTPTISYNSLKTFEDFAYEWILVSDLQKFELYTNLQEKLTSYEAAKEKMCNSLISGGFYTDSDEHIGLFEINSHKISDSYKSPLFNGYFFLNNNYNAKIAYSPPTSAYFALQSGPILIFHKKLQKFSSNNENMARRIVVITDEKGKVIFLVVFNKNSSILGPKLTELPRILDGIGKAENLKIDSALNLDGGSHSAYISETLKLSEISMIGSYFCIKS